MVDFFKHYIHPDSNARAKLAIYLVVQAKSDVSTKGISELVNTLELDSKASTQVATDLKARLSVAGQDNAEETDRLQSYLLQNVKVTQTKIDAAVEDWKKLHMKASKASDIGDTREHAPPFSNGTPPSIIEDVLASRPDWLRAPQLSRPKTWPSMRISIRRRTQIPRRKHIGQGPQ